METEVGLKAKSRVSTVAVIVLLALMYLLVAMSDNFKGIFVPTFKSEFGINDTQIGYILMASLFGYAVFQYFGGILIEKIGSFKKIIVLGFLIEMVSLLILVFCNGYLMLVAGLFGMHAGMALFNVSINTLGPALPVASSAVLMNFLVFCYGVGSTTIQKVTGELLYAGIPWNHFYLFMLAASGVVLMYVFLLKMPTLPKAETSVVEVQPAINLKLAFQNKMLPLYILAAGFYLSCEYGAGNWFANYMSAAYGLNASDRAMYVALFFGTMTFGRLFGGFVSDKFGYYRSVIVYGSLAALLTLAGMFLQESGLILVACSGFFYSLIFPTIILTISQVFKQNVSYYTGLILMCGTLISMVMNMVIGRLNDAVGAYYSYFSIGICLVLCTLVVAVIKRKAQTR